MKIARRLAALIFPRTAEAELEAMRAELATSGMRERSLKEVRFAYENVSDPQSKASLERLLNYLSKAPGKTSIDEVIFCHELWRDFERRGVIPNSVTLELRKRQNVEESKCDPELAQRRVVDIAPPASKKQK